MKNRKSGLMIEDDINGMKRAIEAARAQQLYEAMNVYRDPDIDWTVVTNYDDFVKHITENGIPDMLGFDHDLSDDAYQIYHKNRERNSKIDYSEYKEKTGFHCAEWLTFYCQDNKIKFEADVYAHSMNPDGRENIIAILENFRKFQEKYGTEI